MKLSYKASTRQGQILKGSIEAKDVTEAVNYLRGRHLIPIAVKKREDEGVAKLFSFMKQSHSGDLVLFTRQLSSMLTSGLTLMQSLLILKDQMQNQIIKDMVTGVIADVQEGKSFSSAISKYPKIFSQVYISLIRAGESSGFLDKILLRLADNLEKEEKLKGTLKSALIYPVVVVTLMIVVVFVVMIFVIPQLSVLYQNLNISLPWTTQIVVDLSDLTVRFWPIMLLVGAGLGYGYKKYTETEVGQQKRDEVLLKIPIFGKLIRQTILVEFSRTFGLLISAGTLVVDSLLQTADIAGNRVFKTAILDVSHRVEKGITIGDAMAAYTIFPPILVQMVRIGEQTGKVDDSLLRVSEYFEREVETTVKALTTAMEPIIMIVLGIGVSFLVISIITPIYNLTSSIGS